MLPKQVEEAAQMAEELHGMITGQQEVQHEEPVEEQPVQQEQPAQQDEDIEELRKFKDRYLVLQGKYDAEVPRLHSELKEFKQAVFEKLSQQAAPQEEEQKPQNPRLAKFLEEYGEDFVENIKELLRSEVNPVLQSAVEPVKQQINEIESSQIQAAQQNFMNFLDSKVDGDWRSLWSGQDPKFVEFLQKPDPSGYYTYAELAQMANNNWDGEKLSRIFNDYLGTQNKRQNSPVRDALVAPSRNTSRTSPSGNEKTIWTQDAIKQFEIDDRRGKYDADTSKAMWNDLLSAMSEGRIR